MAPTHKPAVRETGFPYAAPDAIAPFKADAWKRLSPAERLRRVWRMREKLRDLAAIHDRKLFPKP
jgi:hypothetical protein